MAVANDLHMLKEDDLRPPMNLILRQASVTGRVHVFADFFGDFAFCCSDNGLAVRQFHFTFGESDLALVSLATNNSDLADLSPGAADKATGR